MSISRMKDSAGTTHDIIAGGITYATCGTAAGTVAKAATVSAGVFNLFTGAKVTVKFTYANTAASPTLNVGSSGAKAIYWHGAALASSQYWAAGAVLDFVYDGSYWNLVGVAKDNNSTYSSLKNPNALTIQGNGTTLTNGTYDGSAAKTVNITPASIGAAASSHTHDYAASSHTHSNYAASSHTHNYAGSSSAGGAANSVKTNLVVKLNSGSTEGTNLFTFNGSAAKTIDITPSAIGAAASSHTHDYAASSHTHSNYAASSHTHNYAGSSSAGGAATSANKVNTNLVVKLNSGTTEGTNLFTFNGSAAKTIDITPSAIGAAASSHTHDYAASSHNHAASSITSGTLGVARGGTGKASWTANRLVYPSASTTMTQLAFPTTAGSFLRQGTSGAPYWSTPAETLTAIGAAPSYTYSTTDLTAGTSSLTTGKLYFVYE